MSVPLYSAPIEESKGSGHRTNLFSKPPACHFDCCNNNKTLERKKKKTVTYACDTVGGVSSGWHEWALVALTELTNAFIAVCEVPC